MTDYFDNKGEKLEEGFYKHEEYNTFFYYTGENDIEGFPIFKIEGDSRKRYSLYPNLVQQLSKIDKEELKEITKESKIIISEIEKKFRM
jgi:hypothetical protein